MEHTTIARLFADSQTLGGATVTVCGWVRSIRDMKNFGFVMLNDGSCFKDLQVVMARETLANYDEIASQGISSALTCSVESGPMGGQVQEGLSFPGVANADCFFAQTDTIDMYDGGMLDMAFLGGAEIDANGDVNVSYFGGRCIGAGGYIDISQNTKKVYNEIEAKYPKTKIFDVMKSVGDLPLLKEGI